MHFEFPGPEPCNLTLCFLPNRTLNWALSFTCHNCFVSFLQLDSKLIKGQDSSGWVLGVISSFWVQAQCGRGCALVSWSSPLRWDLYRVPGDLARAPAPCLGHTEAPQNFSQDEPWVPMFRKGKPCCKWAIVSKSPCSYPPLGVWPQPCICSQSLHRAHAQGAPSSSQRFLPLPHSILSPWLLVAEREGLIFHRVDTSPLWPSVQFRRMGPSLFQP